MIKLSASLSGIKTYIDELRRFREGTIKETLYGGTQESLTELMTIMQTYPPESEANRPPYPYWARGVGRIHASGNVDPQSEQYGQSWDLQVRSTTFGTDGRLSNSASYAPWVGARQTQAWFHAARGWPNVEDTADKLGLSTTKVAISSRIASRIRGAFANLKSRLQR